MFKHLQQYIRNPIILAILAILLLCLSTTLTYHRLHPTVSLTNVPNAYAQGFLSEREIFNKVFNLAAARLQTDAWAQPTQPFLTVEEILNKVYDSAGQFLRTSAGGGGTSQAWPDITSGTNTNNLTMGTGGTLTTSGTGVINANQFKGSTTIAIADGGTGLSSAVDDNVMVGNGTIWQLKALPNCVDSGGQHLNYTVATNTWSCGTTGDGVGGSAAFNALTSGTNTTAAMVVGSGATLTPTGTGVINATQFKGNVTVSTADGGTGVTAAADDNLLMGNGTIWQSKAIPTCTDVTGNHLNYDAATNTWSCGTTSSGGTPAFNTIATGTNTTAIMTIGTGATLNVSGTGVNIATALAVDPTACTANTFVTDTAANGTLTCTQPSFANLSGTATDAQIPNLNTLSTGLTVSRCVETDGAGNLVSAAGLCGTSGGGGSFNTLTGGTNTTAAMVVGSGASLTPTGTGSIVATASAINPANCSAGSFAAGVDANFVAEGCTDVATQAELDTHAALTTAHGSTAANTASTIVQRDASGNFTAGTITAALTGNATTASALAANGANCASGSAPLGMDTVGAAEGCFDVATQAELDTHTALTTAHSSTSANTASRIVQRDASGNFAAGTITATLTGNATTASAFDHNPTACGANTFATDQAADGTLTCAQPTFTNLSGVATDAQVPDLNTLSTGLTASRCVETNGSGILVSTATACGGTTTAFSAITSATNTTATMTVGTGGQLTFSGTGIVNANQFNGVDIIPITNGGTGLIAAPDDQIMVGNGTAWQPKPIPDCDDVTGNHLNYDTTTNAFTCGTSGGAGGGGSFSAITSGTNTTAAMVVGSGASFDVTGTGTNKATHLGGLIATDYATLAGNQTLLSTFVKPLVVTQTITANAFSINVATTRIAVVPALSAGVTVSAPTASGGFPYDGQEVVILFTPSTAQQSITWNAIWSDLGGLTLPTSVLGDSTTFSWVKFVYIPSITKYVMVATTLGTEPGITTLTSATTYTCPHLTSRKCKMTMTGTAGTVTIAIPSGGTPTDGKQLTLWIKCTNLQSLTLTTGAGGFIESPNVPITGLTCPASGASYTAIGAEYDSGLDRWQVVATN